MKTNSDGFKKLYIEEHEKPFHEGLVGMEQQQMGQEVRGYSPISDDPNLRAYRKDITSYPILTKEEEIDLFKSLRDNNGKIVEHIKEKIINSNLKLVVHIAKTYITKARKVGCINLLDLIQEGNLGLFRAIEKFDWTRDYRFSTYATKWIKNFIKQAIYDARHIHIPDNKIKSINKYHLFFRILRQKLKREPTDQEIASSMNITEAELKEIKGYDIKTDSLDCILEKIGDYSDSGKTHPLEDSGLKEDVNNGLDFKKLLKLDLLLPREKFVIERKLEGFNYEEIAKLEASNKKGKNNKPVERERIRQITQSAVRKMLEYLKENNIKVGSLKAVMEALNKQ